MRTKENWTYCMPTKVIFGSDCVKDLGNTIKPYKPKRVALVTGRKSMEKSGTTSKILDHLIGYNIVVYNEVQQNPCASAVDDGVRFLVDENCDFVIGLGGGSAIDTAKAISVMATNQGSVREYLTGVRELECRGLPLLAIPTTAGTGTEVTQYSSIIDEKRKLKMSLSHDFIRPSAAFVDPVLTVTMPRSVTAVTGLDALSQCVEAYWSKGHTPISDVFALRGIQLVFECLVKAFNSPSNLTSREKMSLSSLFSGIAISIARTTIVHSVSYPLTVRFEVPHGLACSLTLQSFIRYNSKAVKARLPNIARAVGAETVEEFAEMVEGLVSSLGLPTRLSEVGVSKGDIETIVREGFRPDRAENNPKRVTSEDLRGILRALL